MKLVNLLPVEVNTHVDLSGIGAVQPSAKRTVLTGKPADTPLPVEDTVEVAEKFDCQLSAGLPVSTVLFAEGCTAPIPERSTWVFTSTGSKLTNFTITSPLAESRTMEEAKRFCTLSSLLSKVIFDGKYSFPAFCP